VPRAAVAAVPMGRVWMRPPEVNVSVSNALPELEDPNALEPNALEPNALEEPSELEPMLEPKLLGNAFVVSDCA
jgi:hypothetical protein